MSVKQDKFNKRRLQSSYLSVVISMTLVLFLIGLLSTLLYHSKTIANQVQENIAFTVLLKPEAKQIAVKQFQRQLELSEHVKITEFISKNEAIKNLEQDLGEDFISFLGFNPLTDAIDIHFQAYYTQTNKPERIEKELLKIPVVQEVIYDKSLIKLLNDNLQKVSYSLLILSAIFSLIAIALINSSIRLSIYSRRFLIKTMQLVGATKRFIRKPFINKSIQHGLLASVLAILCLDLLLRYSIQFLPEIQRLHKPEDQIILYSSLLCMGLFIPWTCTYFAVRKYLKLTTDELHY